MRHARKDYDRIQDPANLIPAEEPVFLLRGQDFFAPAALRYYADMLRQRARVEPELTLSHIEGLLSMAMTTDAQADLMDAWQAQKKGKFPDVAE